MATETQPPQTPDVPQEQEQPTEAPLAPLTWSQKLTLALCAVAVVGSCALYVYVALFR